jgi:hypothetical protein
MVKIFFEIPFTVEDHLASIRPTTVERRPFCGNAPIASNGWNFNGMGN